MPGTERLTPPPSPAKRIARETPLRSASNVDQRPRGCPAERVGAPGSASTTAGLVATEPVHRDDLDPVAEALLTGDQPAPLPSGQEPLSSMPIRRSPERRSRRPAASATARTTIAETDRHVMRSCSPSTDSAVEQASQAAVSSNAVVNRDPETRAFERRLTPLRPSSPQPTTERACTSTACGAPGAPLGPARSSDDPRQPWSRTPSSGELPQRQDRREPDRGREPRRKSASGDREATEPTYSDRLTHTPRLLGSRTSATTVERQSRGTKVLRRHLPGVGRR